MRQQSLIYIAENIKSIFMISVAEQKDVLRTLNTTIYWTEQVQSVPEVMFKFVKI